jgi:hypothetical protein
MTRRDFCEITGRRARKLTRRQAANAWFMVARDLEDKLSMMELPKFKDVMFIIRAATIEAKRRE